MSSSSSVTWVTASAAAAGAATLGFLLGRWSACKKDSVVIDSSKPVIGTHSGQFHCDEALACFLLRRTDAYRNAAVVRSRDPAVLDKLDILVDVGGAYDVQTNRFDHHQRGFEETFDDEHQTKLSSAGLVYKHFGRGIVAEILGLPLEHEHVELVYQKTYDGFVEALDGIDNGVTQYPRDVKPKYRSRTDVSSRVSTLNPGWNQKISAEETQRRFYKAMEMVGAEFVTHVENYRDSYLPARSLVEEAIASRFAVHPSGQIVLFETTCAWKSHLLQLEEDLGIDTPILYTLFADRSGKWRVQAVPESATSFQSRKALPEEWRGIRDDELSELTGIEGCIFCHASGFIGGNVTREGALQMAIKALEA